MGSLGLVVQESVIRAIRSHLSVTILVGRPAQTSQTKGENDRTARWVIFGAVLMEWICRALLVDEQNHSLYQAATTVFRGINQH